MVCTEERIVNWGSSSEEMSGRWNVADLLIGESAVCMRVHVGMGFWSECQCPLSCVLK